MDIQRISILSIPVSDQEAAKDFYINKLGFKLLRDDPMEEGRQWVQLGLPGAETSLTLVTWFDDMPPGCAQGLVLETGDIQGAHDHLVSEGVEVSDIEEAPWGRFATFPDPDGNGWVLQETRSP